MSFFVNKPNQGGGGTNPPENIDAGKVIESDTKQFISKIEKDQIQLNKTALLSKVDTSQIGVVDGVARLNSQGKVVNSDGSLPSGGSGSVEWEDFYN